VLKPEAAAEATTTSQSSSAVSPAATNANGKELTTEGVAVRKEEEKNGSGGESVMEAKREAPAMS